MNEEVDQMIKDCEDRESRLSDWERSFIDDLANHRAKGRSLTQKQNDKLTEVWERVTS